MCDHCGLVFTRKWNLTRHVVATKQRSRTDAAVLQAVPSSINTLDYPKCDPDFVCD